MTEMDTAGLENAKATILLIEKFCFALNQITVPLRFSEDLIKGFGFVNQMHTQLLEQIGPEEVQKLREQYKSNVPPPIKPQEVVN